MSEKHRRKVSRATLATTACIYIFGVVVGAPAVVVGLLFWIHKDEIKACREICHSREFIIKDQSCFCEEAGASIVEDRP